MGTDSADRLERNEAEIEITPDMIEAGLDVLFSSDIEDGGAAIVSGIFRAMIAHAKFDTIDRTMADHS